MPDQALYNTLSACLCCRKRKQLKYLNIYLFYISLINNNIEDDIGVFIS